MLHTEIDILDQLLNAHASDLGDDFTGYRNHTYRVVNFCVALSSGDSERLHKIAIAAAFHDMGIWTAGTFDYLPPSMQLAETWLERSDRADWVPEISAMIQQHHKIFPYRGDHEALVEPFRRADLVDVSRGVVTFGLGAPLVNDAYRTWPSAGFHKRLVQLEIRRLRTNPLDPLPMVRL